MALETKRLDRQQVFYLNQTVAIGATLPTTLGGTSGLYPIYDGSGHRRVVGLFSSAQVPAAGFPRVRFYDRPDSTATAVATYALTADPANTTNYIIDLPLLTPFFTLEWTMGGTQANVFGIAWIYPEDTVGATTIVQPVLPTYSTLAGYRAVFNGLVAPIGQFFELVGSASKIVRVREIFLFKPNVSIEWIGLLQSIASTGGTSSTTNTKMDLSNVAATATAKQYTVAPTPGTTAGNIIDCKSVTPGDILGFSYGDTWDEPLVIRSGQSFALSTDAIATMYGYVSWTETAS